MGLMLMAGDARADDWWTVKCPSGYSMKTSGALRRCEMVTEAASREMPRCSAGYDLDIGDGRDSCVKPGRDDVRIKVSCQSGWTLVFDDGPLDQDLCIKEKNSGKLKDDPPSCPAGYDYKRRSGRDDCIKPGTEDKVKEYACDSGAVALVDENGDADRCVKEASVKIKSPSLDKQK
jgi:hypothetical protein